MTANYFHYSGWTPYRFSSGRLSFSFPSDALYSAVRCAARKPCALLCVSRAHVSGLLRRRLSNHLIVFLVFWGFFGVLALPFDRIRAENEYPATAKKALIIVGGSDALMILGLALIWRLTGTSAWIKST